MFGRKYSTAYSKLQNGKIITDEMLAKYVKQHMHWWDRFDYHKVCDATQLAFDILCGSVEKPKGKRWYF